MECFGDKNNCCLLFFIVCCKWYEGYVVFEWVFCVFGMFDFIFVELFIFGDFNFYIDDIVDYDVCDFIYFLDIFNLV